MACSAQPKVALKKNGCNLTEASIIGFDLDHCLARYTRPALTHLIFESLVAYLVPERGWPESLLTAEACPELNCKGILFETTTGNLLRLDQNGVVVQAFHGTAQMTSEQIHAQYGTQPWNDFHRLQNMERHENFLLFLTYFDMPAASVLAYMVDAVDAGWTPPADVGESAVAAHSTDPADGHNTPTEAAAKTASAAAEKSYGHLIPDLFRSFNHVFDNVDGFTPRRGGFFSALQDHPEKYLLERPALKHWLQQRAVRKQHTFLATNSCLAFAHFLLQRIFGDEWKSCFDFIVMDARKGAWFNVQTPWLLPDAEQERGGESATTTTWPSTQVFVNGSAQLVDSVHDCMLASASQVSPGGPLEIVIASDGRATVTSDAAASAEALPASSQSHEHTIAEGLVDAMGDEAVSAAPEHASRKAIWYAGDHLHGDVAAAQEHGWNTIAVVEELAYCLPHQGELEEAGMTAVTLGSHSPDSPLALDEALQRQQQLQHAASGCGSKWGDEWFHFPQGVAPQGSVPYYSSFCLKKSSLVVADVADIVDENAS